MLTLWTVVLALLSVSCSCVHTVLVALLYLLVVIAAVASIPSPLRVGRRARRSNYADNNRERDKRAAKCLFHILPSVMTFSSAVKKNLATGMPLVSFENVGFFAFRKYPFRARNV